MLLPCFFLCFLGRLDEEEKGLTLCSRLGRIKYEVESRKEKTGGRSWASIPRKNAS
ncbi:hypothetical protein BDY24DRAFT_377204 [Mrakia frigida]|uniref:uncharacterized protein n=1 Tax=Mrakia frigida TaxID=29902 RepID=UPI003FCC247E